MHHLKKNMIYFLLHHQIVLIIILTIKFILINGDHIYVKWLQNDTNINNNHTCILRYLNRIFHCSLGIILLLRFYFI